MLAGVVVAELAAAASRASISMFRAVIDSSERCSSSDCRKRWTKAETLARSTSASTGVKMKSTAPLAYAAAVSVSSRRKAVRKMIGVCS